VSGNINSQSSLFLIAHIKLSETPTDKLNLVSLFGVCFIVINSSMSGCQSSSTHIIAPFRIFFFSFFLTSSEATSHPLVIISEDLSHSSINLTTPGVRAPIPLI